VITVLTGDIGSGKTTLLSDVCLGNLASDPGRRTPRPRSIAGFLSRRVMNGPRPEGYDLVDLKDGAVRPFLRRQGKANGERAGKYLIIPEGLRYANDAIRRSSPSELLVIDEVGPLELDGRGFWPSLSVALLDRNRKVLVVIRTGLVNRFKALFKGHVVRVVRLDKKARAILEREVAGA
jgi:nucleoside-triphosphatase THEP1